MRLLIPGFLTLLCVFLLVPAGADKVCKAAIADLTKRQMKGVSECTAQMKFKNAKERQARMTCVMKCVLMREGILGADGLADPIGCLKFITLNFPEHVQEWARTVMMKCQEHTATLDGEEEACKTYDPMIKCALTTLNQICNPK